MHFGQSVLVYWVQLTHGLENNTTSNIILLKEC